MQQSSDVTAAAAMLDTGTLSSNTVIDPASEHDYFDDTVHLYEMTTQEENVPILAVNDSLLTAVSDPF